VNTVLYLLQFKTALKQFLGVGQSLTKVKSKNMIVGIAHTVAAPKETRQFIMERSVIMRERFKKSISSTANSFDQLDTNFDWMTWTNDKLEILTYVFSQMAQNMTDMFTWRAAYAEGKNSGMSEAQAIAHADEVVVTTQTSTSVSRMANIQAGKDTKKLFTQIFNVGLGISNIKSIETQRDTNVVSMNRNIALGKIATFAIIIPTIVELAVGDAISDLLDLDDEEEEMTQEEKTEEYLGVLGARSLSGAGDMVVPMLSRGLTGNFGPVFGTAAKTPAALGALYRKTQGVDMTEKDFRNVMNTASFLTGQKFFVASGRANQGGESFLKSDDEKQEEKYTRKYQLRELKYKNQE
jgi:hypothetical protein